MEQLNPVIESLEKETYSKEVKEEMEVVPSLLWLLWVMPKNPAAITEKINEYRKLKAANDDRDSQSLHDYYSNK